MPAILYDISALKPLLAQGEWVLTPNQRLRNRIREAFAADRGDVCLTPPVYSMREWLDRCWQTLQDSGTEGCDRSIVSELQARVLWKEIIEAANPEQVPQAGSRLIQQASEALRNLRLWRISATQLASYGSAEDYPLLDWADTFEDRLQSLGLITLEGSYERILRAFREGLLPRLPTLNLESLAELPPLLQALVDAATDRVVATPAAQRPPTQLVRVTSATAEEEIRYAALWARRHLQQDNTTTIGIIVPDLGTRRDLVERLFTETFEPHYYSPAVSRYTLPFNISTGTPLGKTALVAASLQLLELHGAEVEQHRLTMLFNSSFWSDLTRETSIRSATIEALRRRGQLHYTPAQVRASVQNLAEQSGAGACRQFSQRLQHAANEWRRYSSRATPGEWVERILTVLDLLGWPGSRPLDSVEFQQARQWYQLLENFASLDVLQQPLTFAEALNHLQQLAHSTPFQAEVKDSPIQILGTLEGEGLQFDYCWVLGMTNQAWPPSPQPNPLLPVALQRNQRMPRASLEREISFAASLTEHYRHCANTIVFSHPAQLDDALMLPSPLIADIGEMPVEAVLGEENTVEGIGLDKYYQDTRAGQILTLADCSYGPPLATRAGEPVRGGSAVLQQQALCPFDAFARFRLNATQPVEPSLGLTPADKGSLVHNAMATLWRELKNQHGLLSLDQPQLDALLEQTTQTLFSGLDRGNSVSLGPGYLELERKRIKQLIARFLDFERNRPGFAVVATEEELLRDFAGLTFRLRIDRVDQTDDGHYLIIDYKTGASAKVTRWLGERPDEPQLPLYALCYRQHDSPQPGHPQPVSGIVFACIRAKDPGFCGIVDEPVQRWEKNIKSAQEPSNNHRFDDWPAVLGEFKTNLENLAAEYQQGYAAVLPKSTGSYHNDYLRPLNRLAEAEFLAFYLDQLEQTS